MQNAFALTLEDLESTFVGDKSFYFWYTLTEKVVTCLDFKTSILDINWLELNKEMDILTR